MKRSRLTAIALVAVAAVSAATWWFINSATASLPSPDILTSGFIEATSVSIAPEVGGRILAIAVSEGDTVKAGTSLVKLDDSLLAAQRAQAEAAVAQAQAAVEQAQAVVEQALAGVSQTTMSRNQAIVTRDGVKKAWDNALNVQKYPLELEARLVAAQGQVDIARSNLEQAKDNFTKIAYPYTVYTVVVDVPEALGFINDASREITGALAALQTGLSAEKYSEVSSQLKKGLESLTRSRELLARRGYGDDVLQSGYLSMNQFWTLRAAQLQMDAAQLTLNSVNQTLQITQDIKNNPQQINAAVDSTRAAYDTAAAAVQVAESAVSAAEKQVAIAQKQMGVARKQVEQVQAALEVINVQLSKVSIAAPISGIVASRNAEVGEIATPAAPLLIITDLDSVTLTAYVPESKIGLVTPGQPAIVSVDSYPGQSFSGVVTFISPQALFTPGNVQLKDEREKTVFRVKIKLVNPNHNLKPGMPADARIVVSQ